MMNPYKALLDLLPQRPLQIGTISAISGGVATIELPGGYTATARGDGTVGQKVFFRDGAIEGQAPTLPLEVIEV